MENRFGFKDLVQAVLLLAILASIWLAMKQFDRQHGQMVQLVEQVKQITSAQARTERAVSGLQGMVERGVVAASPGDAAPVADPFERITAAKARPDYAPGDWVIDAFGAQVARITPYISGDAYGSAIIERVVETLADRDPDTLEWRPLLAESWDISDDGLVITFQIRRGVTFSDGEPLTAHDVAYTHQLILNPDIDAPRTRNALAGVIQSVEATGDHEVVFRFAKPYFEAFATAASLPILPEHFYSGFTPEEINARPGLLLGSGPYRMQSPTQWVPGESLALVRNERYWGGVPTFDRMVFQEMNNPVAMKIAFGNGELDIFSAQPEQYVAMLDDQTLASRTQHFEYERPVGGYGFIAWNQRRGDQPTRFADKRVRQAMTMLVPTQRVIDSLLLGYGFGVTGPFNRLSQQYNHELTPWANDTAQAKALLREAGYEDRDGDGVIEGADGEPFRFKYTFPSTSGGDGFWDRLVLMVRDSFAEAGIVVTPDPLEWSVFSEKLKGRDFDAISLAWTAGIETDIHQMFHSDNIGEGADNFMSYANPELDALIDRARSTIDEDERMALWRQAHAIIHEDQPYTFLYSRKSLVFLDDRIENVERVKIGLNDRTEWYVPAAAQKY